MNELILTRKDLSPKYFGRPLRDIGITMFGLVEMKTMYTNDVIIFKDKDGWSWSHLKNRYGEREVHQYLETKCDCSKYHLNDSHEHVLVCPFCDKIWRRF